MTDTQLHGMAAAIQNAVSLPVINILHLPVRDRITLTAPFGIPHGVEEGIHARLEKDGAIYGFILRWNDKSEIDSFFETLSPELLTILRGLDGFARYAQFDPDGYVLEGFPLFTGLAYGNSGVKWPDYVATEKGLTLSHWGDGLYQRTSGLWYIQTRLLVDGTVVMVKGDKSHLDHLIGGILKPCSKEAWMDDNGIQTDESN